MRVALVISLVTSDQDLAQNEIFEKYIDAVLRDHASWHNPDKFTVYVYFTSQGNAIRGTDLFHGKKLDETAPFKGLCLWKRCTAMYPLSTVDTACRRYGLRMVFKQLCNVTPSKSSHEPDEMQKDYSWIERGKERQNGPTCGLTPNRVGTRLSTLS